MKIGKVHRRTTDPECRQGARKALLIGINYDSPASLKDSECPPLRKCRDDVLAMRALLIDCYGYIASDIAVMLDAAGYRQPTHDNMIFAMKDLVKGVRPGDRLVFMFAGHCCQIPCHHHTEADDFDEVLMPMDHEGTRTVAKLIIDNDLRRLLVNPLCPGVRFTAILDACHSGTLLDLDHYTCNRLWTPRISRGPRGEGSRRQAVQRKTAVLPSMQSQVQAKPPSRRSSAPSRMLSMDAIFSVFRDSVPEVDRRPTFLSERVPSPIPETFEASENPDTRKGRILDRARRTVARPMKEAFALIIRRHLSPPPTVSMKCDGWCMPTGATARSIARVISIAACGDQQSTWEDKAGRSMTMALVNQLRQDPHPNFRQLILRHARDTVSLRLHAAAKKQHKKSHHSRNVVMLDGVNFQDVQVGSQEKLEMEAITFEL